MGADQHFDWLSSAASTLDWWQEAGVDCLVEDAPRDWLTAEPEPFAPPAPVVARRADAAPIAPVAPAPAALSDDHAAFTAWRTSADAPEAPWRGIAIAASGPIDAPVMVLVDCPDADDGEAGVLMAGQVGALFDRMLAAIGLSRETVHLASVCAKRPVAGRMPREIEARLTEIARHQVGLAAPETAAVPGQCGEPCDPRDGDAGEPRAFTRL